MSARSILTNFQKKILIPKVYTVRVRARIQGPSLLQDPTYKIRIKDPCRNEIVLYKTLSNTRPHYNINQFYHRIYICSTSKSHSQFTKC